MEYKINASDHGRSVLEFARSTAGLSAATLRHLKFTEGGITVDGKHVTVRHILTEGERLSLAFEDTEPQECVLPVDLPLSLISQYCPVQYRRIRSGALEPQPMALLLDWIGTCMDDYLEATR